MLFKLSLKNIQKGVRDYAIYFVTLVLGIAIFYVFNAIETQASFLELSDSASASMELMMGIITGLSVFVAIVLGLLIVYASRFLMKRRNREFALYMMMGMRKGTIAGALTLENLIIGILSLAVGLAGGIFLSQLMSMLVVQLFEADMAQFTFTFSTGAFLKTILYFGVIMAAVLLFNLIMVGKARLIRLMQSGSRVEKVKMKNPVLCVIFFVLGAACLVYAYWAVTSDIENYVDIRIMIPIYMGIAGTFFVFWSTSGLMLTILSRLRGTYFKGLNSFTFRQFSSRINTMVISMTVICVMLFFTISGLSAAFSLRSSFNRNVRELVPVDVDIEKNMMAGEQEEDPRLTLTMKEMLSEAGFDADQMLSEYAQVSMYETDDFTFREAFAKYLGGIGEEFPQWIIDSNLTMMTEGDYNKVATLYGNETVDLGTDAYAVICNMDRAKPDWDRILAGGEKISVFGHEMKPKYPETRYGFVQLSSTHDEAGLVLIPDEAADPAYRFRTAIMGNYRAADKKECMAVEEQLKGVLDKISTESGEGLRVWTFTKLGIRGEMVSSGAIVTFLGLYLGFVFLISGAAVLALKAISDCMDSKGRYHMLRQLGAEEKEITGSLRKQQALLFLLPLGLAAVHSIFGMRFTQILLFSTEGNHTTESMLLTAAIILLVYIGYFFMTFRSSRKIIRE